MAAAHDPMTRNSLPSLASWPWQMAPGALRHSRGQYHRPPCCLTSLIRAHFPRIMLRQESSSQLMQRRV
jgi:hypothetical protein